MFRRYLSADDILHCRIVREDGDVTEVAIAYEMIVEGTSYQPCRVDNAHGEMHMDRLSATGEKLERVSLGPIEPRQFVPAGLGLLLEVIERERDRILGELGIALD